MLSKYTVQECMIMDQDSAFMTTLIKYLFMESGIKIKTVTSYNRQFLQVEHGMKSLATTVT